ncbi:hypothetical protein WUBG_11424, partial [Wuchereria bancrofti]
MTSYLSKTRGPPTTFANVSQCMVAAARGFLTTRPPTVLHLNSTSKIGRLQR